MNGTRNDSLARATGRGGRRGAFTLVEMLVVLAVLAILVALTAGVSSYVTRQAARKKTQQYMEIIHTALDAYRNVAGAMPAGAGGANYRAENGALLTALKSRAESLARVQALPADGIKDVGGTAYLIDGFGNILMYQVAGGAGGAPVLISPGPDGRFGEAFETSDTNIQAQWQADNIRSDDR